MPARFISADTTGDKSTLSLEDKVPVWPSAPVCPQSVSLENIFHLPPLSFSLSYGSVASSDFSERQEIYSLVTHCEDREKNNEG